MLVIGLTGGIGSGKSAAANFFAEHAIPIIDADRIAKQLTSQDQTIIAKISEHFTQAVLNQDGSLNRNHLRQIIFNQPQEKQWLENLLHPLIRNEIKKGIEIYSNHPYMIIVIPLLYDLKPYPYIQRVLVIDSPIELQIARVMQRDTCDEALACKMIAAQISRNERLAIAHDIIVNDASLAVLHARVEAMHQFYMQLSSQLS